MSGGDPEAARHDEAAVVTDEDERDLVATETVSAGDQRRETVSAGDGAPKTEVVDTGDGQEEVVRRLRWWHEVAFAAFFYGIYSLIRNTQGSALEGADTRAFRNALRVIDWQKALGLNHEHSIQEAFLDQRWFIEFWNLFYGSFHFIVTVFALVLLFRRFPDRYPRWRNTLAATTALALIGFATFPLMPPRLLPGHYGSLSLSIPASENFVDTLREYGSLWSFDSGAMHKISNQYAAMPSLHFAWATWCTFVLVPALRRWWSKGLALAYPLLTLFAIVVTANHFILDAAGGLVVLAVGTAIGFTLDTFRRRQLAGRIQEGGADDGEEAPTVAAVT